MAISTFKKNNSQKIPLYKWHLPKCGGGHNFSTMATIFWIFSENLKRIIENFISKSFEFFSKL
jgi:hypothetical protein